jgi:uncharacterized protein (TIGR02145 family)
MRLKLPAPTIFRLLGWLFWFIPGYGQVQVTESGPLIVVKVMKGLSQEVEVIDPRGSLQWQQSDDGRTWRDMNGQTECRVEVPVLNDLFLRCAISDRMCDPVFSDAVKLIPFSLPTVITGSITYADSTLAIGGGTVTGDGNETVTARGVCWSTAQFPEINDRKTSDGTGIGVFNSHLTGLLPNTVYNVRAYAVNRAGTAYGEQVGFKTAEVISDSGIFTDPRDSTDYDWVRLGTQVWMRENLAWLPAVTGPAKGSTDSMLYYVYGYYGSDPAEAKMTANYALYGALYNWPAALSACPDGWHLPSDDEWIILENFLGGADVAGGRMKESGTAHWREPNTGATNISGFTALPAGDRSWWLDFYYLGESTFFWSSTEADDILARNRGLGFRSSGLENKLWTKEYGFSIRCISN